MAAREHRVSRRVLLGAAWTFPLVLAAPRRRPGPSTEKWNRALAAFRRAQAVIDAAASEPDQRRYDALLDTFTAALRRLLRTPAPDLAALSVKIGLVIDHLAWELTGGEACMAALRRDARRLAGMARN